MATSGDAKKEQIAQFMKDPKIMRALHERLSDLEGMQSPFFESLPKTMKNRVYAIRNIQRDHVKLEAEFYNEINQVEQKFHEKYLELYDRRLNIISGKYEPKADECEHSEDEDDEEETKEVNGSGDAEGKNKDMTDDNSLENASKDDDLPSPFPEDVVGVPEFWSTVLRSAATTNELIDECDENILKSLSNITLNYLKPEEACTEEFKDGIIGFRISFHFDENDYFSDKVLTKTYKLRLTPDEEDVLTYEGPEIIECIGCKINWKSDEVNVTKTIIKKKQKNKKTGAVRVITSSEAKESFFNYFSSIEDKLKLVKMEDTEIEEDEDQESFMREADYEIGHFIRERLIPKAVLYYTGELNDEDDEEDYEEDDDEDFDDDDEEEGEEDPDFDPSQAKDQPECKQQ